MHPWFAQYMQAELEKFLPDPYADICQRLTDGASLSFSRFGDGELNAVFGVEGTNSDGHRYFPELGRRLREIVESVPKYMMGLQTHAVLVHGALPIKKLSPRVDWVLADALHNASMEGTLSDFLNALDARDVVLAGAPHHRALAGDRSWRFMEIEYGDCWEQYDSLRENLERTASEQEGQVFLLCASMTANVLVDDLFRHDPNSSYLDVGSVLDPLVGVNSRLYHHDLGDEPLRGISSS